MFKINYVSLGSKTITMLILFFLASCSYFTNITKKGDNNSQSEIRIVDLNGNPKPIKRYIPAGNAEILAKQKSTDANSDVQNSQTNKIANPNEATQPYFDRPAQNSQQSGDANIYSGAASGLNNESDDGEINISYDISQSQNPQSQNSSTTNQEEVKYSSNNNAENNIANKKFKVSVKKSNTSKTQNQTQLLKNGYFVQIGAYSISQNAKEALESSKKVSFGQIKTIKTNNKTIYRVLLGPVSNKNKARNVLNKAKNAGYKDAFIAR
jgi:cell division protein FtsN